MRDMKLIERLKALFTGNQTLPATAPTPTTPTTVKTGEGLADRLARLERNYLVLLKRVLAIDGIELQFSNGKTHQVSKTITITDNKGLNERKPTLH